MTISDDKRTRRNCKNSQEISIDLRILCRGQLLQLVRLSGYLTYFPTTARMSLCGIFFKCSNRTRIHNYAVDKSGRGVERRGERGNGNKQPLESNHLIILQ